MFKEILNQIHYLRMQNKKQFALNRMQTIHQDVNNIFALLQSVNLPLVSVQELHSRLGFHKPLEYPEASLVKPLTKWKMEIDDAPIFRYLYRSFAPQRHLEFGTWYGAGTVYCLEECAATVWTINLPQGELLPDGTPAYGHGLIDAKYIEAWARRIGVGKNRWGGYRTDTLGFIGQLYLEKNLGNRVCQIYCDSRDWDIRQYPAAFFDSVLIDGGHGQDVVASDTEKALSLLRPGGLLLWHDFCPDKNILSCFKTSRDVVNAVLHNWDHYSQQLADLFWINPSFILLGIKR